ncbi:MAG: amino acid permease [Candidatus Gastranaerophilaceae bacterium]|jgi:APA family basic amino acid/polyamine antiporter
MSTNSFLSRILRKKNLDEIIETSKKSSLKKTLNAFDLTVLGIGAIIGAGIFTLSGTAAAGSAHHVGAGPGLMLSFIFAGFACALAALCYAEFAAMIPVAGSAYTYTFATLGELAAWLIGWILMLEYAIGNITVACGWSGYLFKLLEGFKGQLPDFITNQAYWIHHYRMFGHIPLDLNIPALFIIAAVTALLYKGVQESTRMAAIMVIIKLAVILLFIFVGAHYVQPSNWTPFLPNGFKGVFVGAFLVFFAYIGFDAVSTAAEETKNPQKDLPIGIIASLIICTIIYIIVAGILTGIVPWNQIDTAAPVAAAMRSIHQNWTAGLIAVGAVAGLSSVLLVLQLGTTRILFAMSRDKLLPSVFSKIHPKFRTPHVITLISGIFVAIGTVFLDLNAAAELCNIGTLSAFLIVCLGVLILRKTDPTRERPFKVPFSPYLPVLGIIVCLALIVLGVPQRTLILFSIWLIAGLVIYFSYGFKRTSEVDAIETSIEEIPAAKSLVVE